MDKERLFHLREREREREREGERESVKKGAKELERRKRGTRKRCNIAKEKERKATTKREKTMMTTIKNVMVGDRYNYKRSKTSNRLTFFL